MNFDNPVVLNLNPFFLLEDDPTPARNHQVTRAASLVVSALEFIRAVRKEELPPDTLKGTPLCMYQFSRLFGTSRVPTESGCQIEQDPNSKHMVVMCHGQIYWFEVLDDNSDVIMTERDIAINLQTILDDAAKTPIQEAAKGALGVLSTENRKTWSGLRDALTREPESNNADCLNIVDSALFALCLDYTEPANVADLCQNMLCGTSEIRNGVQIGTCTNRWYDKLQIIVCKNGSAGINFEHTGVDGHTVLRFASDVYTDTILRFARSINGQAPSLWTTTSPDPSKRDPSSFGDVNTTPRKLGWDMIPELSIAVRFAETRLADLIEQNEFQCLDFGSYGKNFITSMGFSPDAFVQMAFQAAYYGLYGRVECSYEPAMTKFYLHGRTEAVRQVTDESVKYVQTFWGDNPPDQKLEALKAACQKHVANTKECSKAEGCDRHLYALFCVWQKYVDGLDSDISSGDSYGPSSPRDGFSDSDGVDVRPSRDRGDSTTSRSREYQHLPLLFADSGWDKLNNTVLSTSNCGNPALRHFGFGPTSGDGFGIGYIIKDESISICVSSKHRQTKRFVDALESYLLEIRRILRLSSRKSSSAKVSRAREAESSRPTGSNRVKTRGRLITGSDPAKGDATSGQPPAAAAVEDSGTTSDDDELGGCKSPPPPPSLYIPIPQSAPPRTSLLLLSPPVLPPSPPSTPPPNITTSMKSCKPVLSPSVAIAKRSQSSLLVSMPSSSSFSMSASSASESACSVSKSNVFPFWLLYFFNPRLYKVVQLLMHLRHLTDGFFDAGMLLQALKGRSNPAAGEGEEEAATKPSERATVQARRRDVGKKLRLTTE